MSLQIAECEELAKQHALLSYDVEKKQYFMIAFQKVQINCEPAKVFPQGPAELLRELAKATSLDVLAQFGTARCRSLLLEDYQNPLEDLAQLHFPCEKCDVPHVFFFQLPSKTVEKSASLYIKQNSLLSTSLNLVNPKNKVHDNAMFSNWTADDREQLKKLMLLFGYGRWK